METLKFNSSSFVLYQILPDHKKIDFLNQIFDGDTTQTSKKFFEQHFKEIIAATGSTEIGIISYITTDGDKINVFFHKDHMHINSNKLIPIRDLISAVLRDGNIVVLDTDMKKTKSNRDRFHMRYYRAYRRANPTSWVLPIFPN